MRPEEYATYRGRETEFQSIGQSWRVRRFDLDVIDDFTDWARRFLPDPISVAEKKVEALAAEEYTLSQQQGGDEGARKQRLHYLRSQQDRLTRMALNDATGYLAWNGEQMTGLRNSPRGGAQLLYLLLRTHQPEITPQIALNILVAVPAEKLAHVLAVAMGRAPAVVSKQPAALPGASRGK